MSATRWILSGLGAVGFFILAGYTVTVWITAELGRAARRIDVDILTRSDDGAPSAGWQHARSEGRH